MSDDNPSPSNNRAPVAGAELYSAAACRTKTWYALLVLMFYIPPSKLAWALTYAVSDDRDPQ